MGQPVKLSPPLLLQARIQGKHTNRSIASQVEYWARLGRVLDFRLRGHQAVKLLGAAEVALQGLESADTPEGRERAKQFLDSKPFPHYQSHPLHPGLLLRIEHDGKQTTGKFVNRKFTRVKVAAGKQRNDQ